MHFLAALTLLADDNSTSMAGPAMGAFFAAYGIFVLIVLIISIVIYWRIASKAGYPGAYSLLMLIPLVNLIVLLIFAFGEWPIERQLAALRGGSARPPASIT
jgi:hypothetical protein